MTLGAKIRQLRKRMGATQKKIAACVGTSIDTYRRWEWGRLQPQADYLVRLVAALDTTVEVLLGTTEEEEAEHGEGGESAAVAEDPGAA